MASKDLSTFQMRVQKLKRIAIPKSICDALEIEVGDRVRATIEKIGKRERRSYSSKFQMKVQILKKIAIPKAICDALGIKEGDRVRVTIEKVEKSRTHD